MHSVVLLAVPFCKRPQLAGSLIAGGIILFSGSMYTIVLSGNSKFGVITVVFINSWYVFISIVADWWYGDGVWLGCDGILI